MRRWLINVAKNETILIVAAILALISCFIVPPDADYKSYIHANTISQLICLMIVVCGFQRIGVFRIIGSRLLEKVSTMRGLVITLVALTFFSSMFITNDVALVMFVPFAVAVLIMAGQEDKTRRPLGRSHIHTAVCRRSHRSPTTRVTNPATWDVHNGAHGCELRIER